MYKQQLSEYFRRHWAALIVTKYLQIQIEIFETEPSKQCLLGDSSYKDHVPLIMESMCYVKLI